MHGIRHDRAIWTTAALLYTYPVQSLRGAETAEEAAYNYRLVRRQGITIRGTIEVIIATWHIAAGARIIHNDRDPR